MAAPFEVRRNHIEIFQFCSEIESFRHLTKKSRNLVSDCTKVNVILLLSIAADSHIQ